MDIPDPSLITSNVFTTANQLLGCVDKKLMVFLRDGRKFIGILRSFDQFANLVLQDTVERIYVDQSYGDIERGVFLIRGENVVLLGEIDLDIEDDINLRQISPDMAIAASKRQLLNRKSLETHKNEILFRRGFSHEGGEGDYY